MLGLRTAKEKYYLMKFPVIFLSEIKIVFVSGTSIASGVFRQIKQFAQSLYFLIGKP